MTYVSASLRRLVTERAGGCCEYCRMRDDTSDRRFQIEHIIAVAHGGRSLEDSLALSCPPCNWFKSSHIAGADPETGDPTFLFHPRRHLWPDHFRLDSAIIEPLTPEGRATVFLLRLNSSDRVTERRLLLQVGSYPCPLPVTD